VRVNAPLLPHFSRDSRRSMICRCALARVPSASLTSNSPKAASGPTKPTAVLPMKRSPASPPWPFSASQMMSLVAFTDFGDPEQGDQPPSTRRGRYSPECVEGKFCEVHIEKTA
jgi:hypothetical protein